MEAVWVAKQNILRLGFSIRWGVPEYIASGVNLIDQAVTKAFADFVEANCVSGADRSVHIQKIECAFALYLKDNDVKDVLHWWYYKSYISVAHAYVAHLVSRHGWELTPGFTPLKSQDGMVPIQLDTRYVIGVDVRFRKS